MARTPTPTGGTATGATTTTTTTETGGQTDTTSGTDEGGSGGDGDPDPNAKQTETQSGEAAEPVAARVTLEFEGHAVNAVISVPADRAAQLEGEGYIDTHPKAVAYAQGLNA